MTSRVRSLAAAAVVAASLVAITAGAGPGVAAPVSGIPPLPLPPLPVVERAETKVLSTLIGTGTSGDTGRRFGVEGTDLGHTFLHKGRLAALFGDTYGAPPADPFFSVKHRDWRSNTLGWLDPDVAPGSARIVDMVTDPPGRAKELLGSKKIKGDEETVIPTYGISTGDRMWMHYMSVKAFGAPGRWTLNSAGVAHSDDDGRTWTKDPGAVWPGSTRFGQVAYVRPAEDPDDGEADGDADDAGDTVYVYGVPGGRYGSVSLARVPAARLGDKSAYSYRTESGWSRDESAATDVVAGPVGELSVRYHRFYDRWLMMYLVDPTGEVVLRSSESPTGPWSEPQVVTTTKEFSEAYAPYLTPVWNDGPDVVFTMSRYKTYRVSLMRTRLNLRPAGTPLPLDVRITPPGSAPQLPFVPYPYGHGGRLR